MEEIGCVLIYDINVTGIADSITNCKWMDEEYYKVAIPRKDVSINEREKDDHALRLIRLSYKVLQGIQLTFIGNPYPLRHAIERASKVSGAHILGQNLAPHDGMDTSKITQDLTSNNIDPNIPICIVTDEEAFAQGSKNVQVRTIKCLVEVLAYQRETNRI